MSKFIRTLQETRAAVVEKMNNLNQLAAKEEERGLTDTEQKNWDSLVAEEKELQVKIDRAFQLEGLNRGLTMPSGTSLNSINTGNKSTVEGVKLTDSEGKEVRLYRLNEKVVPNFSESVLGSEMREALTRALNTGSATLPVEISSQMIDILRPHSVLFKAGALVLPMAEKTVKLIKQLTDPAVSWVGEAQQITDSQPTFGEVTLDAKKLCCLVKISWEMLQDNPIELERRLPQILGEAMAAEVDRVILEGEGTADEPQGIKGQVSSIAVNGQIDWDAVIDALEVTDAANAGEPSALVLHSRDARDLSKLKGSDGHYINKPLDLSNVPLLKTNKIAVNGGSGTNESAAYIGKFSDIVWGQRTQIQFQRLNERYADSGQVAFLVWLRGDVAILRNNTVCELTGIKPSTAQHAVIAGRAQYEELEAEVVKNQKRAVKIKEAANAMK